MSSDEVPSAGGTGLWGTRRIKTYAAAFTVLVAGTVGIAFAVRRPSVHDFTPAWEEKFVIDKTELLQVDCDQEHPLDGGVVLTYLLEHANDAECPYEDYEDGSCYKSIEHCSSQKVLLPNAEDCDEENDYSAICDGDNVNLTFFEEGGYVGQSCDDYRFLSAYMDDEENDASKLFGGVCSTERKLSDDDYTKGCQEDFNGGRCAHNMAIKEDKPWVFEMDWKVKAKKRNSWFHFHFHNTKNVFGSGIHTTDKFRDCGRDPDDSAWNRPRFRVKKGKTYTSGNAYYAYELNLQYSTSKNLWDTPKGNVTGGTYKGYDGKRETDVLMYVNTEDWDGHINIRDAEPWGDRRQPRKGDNPAGCKLLLRDGDVTVKPAKRHKGKCAMWIKANKKKERDCQFRNLCKCPEKTPFWCYGDKCATETPSNNDDFPDSKKFDCDYTEIKVGDEDWERMGIKYGRRACPR